MRKAAKLAVSIILTGTILAQTVFPVQAQVDGIKDPPVANIYLNDPEVPALPPTVTDEVYSVIPPVLEKIPNPTNISPVPIKGTAPPGATVMIRYGLSGSELQAIPPIQVDESGSFETSLPAASGDGWYTIRAKSVLGGAESFEPEYGFFFDGTPPGQPRNPRWSLFPTENSGVVILWDRPFVPGSDGVLDESIQHYEVYRDGDLLGNRLNTDYPDMNLGDMQYHEYEIVAVDRAGNKSEPAVVRAGTGYHDAILASPGSFGYFSNGVTVEQEMNQTGSKIAFISNAQDLVSEPLANPGAYHLYKRDLSTNQTTLIGKAEMNGDYGTERLALDASGAVTVYVSDGRETAEDTDNAPDIYVHDEETASTRLVSEGEGSAGSPSISGDGTLIVYERTNGGGSEIVLYNRSAKSSKVLAAGQHPTLSSDGRVVVYADGDKLFQYELSRAQSEPVQLPGELEYAEILETSSSSDGGTLAITVRRTDASQTIYVYRELDRTWTEVYDTPGESRFVLYSPKVSGDGNKLIFGFRHADGNDFYARANHGSVLYDIESKNPTPVSNQALVTEKATIDSTGNTIAFISSDWQEDPERRNVYLKCFRACGEIPPPQDKPIAYADVYYHSMVNGQLPIGSSFTVAASYASKNSLQAIITIRNKDSSELKETLALTEETDPGIYRADYTLPASAYELVSIRVERTDKPEIFRDIAPLPRKMAGQVKLSIQTPYAPLLSNTKIVATSAGKATGNQIRTDGNTEYVIPLADAKDYVFQAVNPKGVIIGTLSGVIVKNGEETEASLKLTPAAELSIHVYSTLRQPVVHAKVQVEKNGESSVYSSDSKGIVRVPGVHYQGEKVKISVLAEKPYSAVPPKEIDLQIDENEVRFDLPVIREGTVNGKVTDQQDRSVGKALQVIFYNERRSVAATTDLDGNYSIDLPADNYNIQVVSDKEPYYALVFGSNSFVAVNESKVQTKNLKVNTVGTRLMNIHLFTKKLDGQFMEVPLTGYDQAVTYGLTVKSSSASFHGNGRDIRKNQLIVQGAAGDTVNVCVNGESAGFTSQCREVQLNGAGDTDVELRITEMARVRGTLSGTLDSNWYYIQLESIDESGKAAPAGTVSISGKNLAKSVGKPGRYRLALVPNRNYYYSTYKPPNEAPRAILKTFDIAAGENLDLGPIPLQNLYSQFAGKQGNLLETTTRRVAPGGIAKFRATYTNGSAYGVEEAELLIHVPSHAELREESVVLNGKPVPVAETEAGVYAVQVGQLSPKASGILLYEFRVDSELEQGVLDTHLDIRYRTSDGQTDKKTEPLGNERLQIGILDMVAPKAIATTQLYLRGYGPSGKKVDVAVDGKAVGSYPITAGGTWEADIALEPKPKTAVWRENPVYKVSSQIQTDDGAVDQETAYVEYDPELPSITQVEITQPHKSVRLDTSQGVPDAYMSIYPQYSVLFAISATHPERIENMALFTGVSFATKYDSKTNTFRGSVDPNIHRLSPNGVYVKYDTTRAPYEIKDVDQTELELAKEQLPEPWRSASVVMATKEETDAILDVIGTDNAGAAKMADTTFVHSTPFVKVSTTGKKEDVIFFRMTFKKLTNYSPVKKYKSSTAIPYSDLNMSFDGHTLRFSYVAPADFYQGSSGGVSAFGSTEHLLNILEFFQPDEIGPLNKIWAAKDLLTNLDDLDKFLDDLLAFQDQVINSECHMPTVKYFNDQIELIGQIGIRETQLKYVIGSVAAAFSAVELPAALALGISTATTVAGDVAVMDRDRLFNELKKEFEEVQKWRDDMAEAGVFPRCEDPDDDDDDDDPPPPPPDVPDGPPGSRPLLDMRWSYDPSGYVYEGMTSNRLRDVVTTVFYKDEESRWVQWDAGEYGQNNPLVTDKEGKYAWDVPEGLWKVRYEKDGYLPAESAELEVLPPHFDVNVPLVTYSAPEFTAALGRGGGESVQLHFSKPMIVDSVNATTVSLENEAGEPVAGTIEPALSETNAAGIELAMVYRFIPAQGPLASGRYRVKVSTGAQSYAGVMLDVETVKEVRIDPSAPTPDLAANLTLLGGDRSVTAEWEETSSEAANRVRLYIRKTGDDWSEPVTLDMGVREYSFAGLAEDTEYEVKIVTVGWDDRESPGLTGMSRTSARPDSLMDLEAPSEVTEASARTVGSSIRLTWLDPAEEDFTKVRVAWKEKGSDAEPQTTYVDQGDQQWVIEDILPGKSYAITLSTVDRFLNHSKGVVVETGRAADTQPPGEVEEFKATSERTSIGLSWKDPSDADLDHLMLTWKQEGGRAEPESILIAKGAQKHTIHDVKTGKTYLIELKTVDQSGNISKGLTQKVKVLPRPQEPDPNPGPNPNPGPFPPGHDATIVKIGKDSGYEAFGGKLKLGVLPGTFKQEVDLQINRREIGTSLPAKYKAGSMSFEMTADPAIRPAKPVTLTLKYDQERLKGYDLRRLGIYRKSADGTTWDYVGGVLDRKQEAVQATVNRFGTYALLIYDHPFQDLAHHWSRADVDVLVSRHWMKGISETHFEPDRPISRAELVSLLVRFLKANGTNPVSKPVKFKDVPNDSWYAADVLKGASLGIVQGSGGLFRPNDAVTREEMLVMVLRAFGETGETDLSELQSYSDGSQTSHWAQPAMAFSLRNDWLTGSLAGKQLKPRAKATRAETAAMVLRLLEYSGFIEVPKQQK